MLYQYKAVCFFSKQTHKSCNVANRFLKACPLNSLYSTFLFKIDMGRKNYPI